MKLVLILTTSLLFPCLCFADFSGQVIGVVDGDTIRVLDDQNVTHKVRLLEIDSPEMAQPFGMQAKQALANLIFQRPVLVQSNEIDKYGRELGTVFYNHHNINMEMVRKGYAWAYRYYLKDQTYILLEDLAKEDRKGLWKDKNPVAPWDWRHNSKK
jgi:endonuclease YncB( thermonuclease family)